MPDRSHYGIIPNGSKWAHEEVILSNNPIYDSVSTAPTTAVDAVPVAPAEGLANFLNQATTFTLEPHSSLAFNDLVKRFQRWAKNQPLPPLALTSGVHTLSAEQCGELLIRNQKNRQISYATVYAYALQIINGKWKMTGQPVIFTNRGMMLDGQHRCWAGFLSGKPISIYVITDVPHEDQLFAYIDNSKPRTGADALQVAGINGMSSHIAAVVREVAIRWDHNYFKVSGPIQNVAMSNQEVLAYVQSSNGLVEAVKLAQSYKRSAQILGNPKVASFLVWKILEKYGEDVVNDFMTAIADDELPEGHPIIALRKKVDLPKPPPRSRLRPETLPMQQILGYAIKAFNLMVTGQRIQAGRLRLDVREEFPQFVEPAEAPLAAAAQ